MANEEDYQICRKCLVLCTILKVGGSQNRQFILLFSIFSIVNKPQIFGFLTQTHILNYHTDKTIQITFERWQQL